MFDRVLNIPLVEILVGLKGQYWANVQYLWENALEL